MTSERQVYRNILNGSVDAVAECRLNGWIKICLVRAWRAERRLQIKIFLLVAGCNFDFQSLFQSGDRLGFGAASGLEFDFEVQSRLVIDGYRLIERAYGLLVVFFTDWIHEI